MALKLQSRDLPAILSGQHPDYPQGLDKNDTHSAYNGLDSAVTLRVQSALTANIAKRNEPHASTSYQFLRAMQGPALEMMLRGVAIQQQVRHEEIQRYTTIKNKAQSLLDRLADAVWGPEEYTEITRTKELYHPTSARTGKPLSVRTRTVRSERVLTRPRGLNPNSPTQILAFFNVALQCPIAHEVRKTPAGTIRTPTANDKTLRRWAQRRTKGPGISPRDHTVPPINFCAPFVSLILTIRDAVKVLSVLNMRLDPDGRGHCSYNVAGTKNGRWSSSESCTGTGSNFQNIDGTLRRMFCADDGYRLVSTDLEQAESYITAGCIWEATGDDAYWKAILSGDLHTQVCRMTWPELEWTDDPKANRKIADRPFPGLPHYTYRDVAKRLGHGTNYMGSAYGIAEAVGIPHDIVEDFQHRYLMAFSAHVRWHDHVKTLLRGDRYLDTPLGRRRHFLKRPTEDSTLRDAIAFVPQSTVAELLNLVMYRVWIRSKLHTTDPQFLPIQLLLQVHDAFVFQTPMNQPLAEIIHAVNLEFQSIKIPFSRGTERRTMTIPAEFVTGWNWSYKDKSPDQATWKFEDGNPDGLAKWNGSDIRSRQQAARTTAADWLGL